MNTLLQKANNAIDLARKKTEDFLYGHTFPLLLTLITLVFWVANLQFVGFSVLVLSLSFVLITQRDAMPLLMGVMLLPTSFNDSNLAFQTHLPLLIVILSVLGISAIFHLIKYPVKKFYFDKVSVALVLVIFAYIIGGLFSGYYHLFFSELSPLLIAGVSVLFLHSYLGNYIEVKENYDYRKYFCICFIVLANSSCFQLLFPMLKQILLSTSLHNSQGYLAWANSNTIANLVIMAVPLCCYVMLSSKKIYLWFIQLVFFYGSVLLSKSDGCLAALLAITPFLMIITYKYSNIDNKKLLKVFFSLLIASAILVMSAICLLKWELIAAFLETATNGTSRNLLYGIAAQAFFLFPVFGVGMGGAKHLIGEYVSNGLIESQVFCFFHSTFFQIIACLGLVGLAVYVYYYCVRFKHLAKNDTVLGTFAIVSLVLFSAYAMIDTSEFVIVVLYMTIIITFTGLTNTKGSDDKPLPLSIKRFKF